MPPDLAELRRLVERHGAGLALYAKRICRDPEDAAQMALAKYALLDTPPADAAAWLYTTCRREALRLARADRRRRAREVAWFAPATAPDIDGEAVRLACGKLPPGEAEAVTLHLWGGLTFAQIGAIVGVSAATAHRRYASGLARLREWLGDLA